MWFRYASITGADSKSIRRLVHMTRRRCNHPWTRGSGTASRFSIRELEMAVAVEPPSPTSYKLDAGVADGLGDGGQSGVVGDGASEPVGDVAHSQP